MWLHTSLLSIIVISEWTEPSFWKFHSSPGSMKSNPTQTVLFGHESYTYLRTTYMCNKYESFSLHEQEQRKYANLQSSCPLKIFIGNNICRENIQTRHTHGLLENYISIQYILYCLKNFVRIIFKQPYRNIIFNKCAYINILLYWRWWCIPPLGHSN